MKVMYEIYTDTFEFRMGSVKSKIPSMSPQEIFDSHFDSGYVDPCMEVFFDNEKEAVEHWQKNYADYGLTWLERGNTQYLLRGEIAWMDEVQYYDDGEVDQTLDTIVFSAEPYEKEE